MSKNKANLNSIKKSQKRILPLACIISLTVAFIFVWTDIYLTSKKFEIQMGNMVQGVDYFVEDVPIVAKRRETDNNDSVHESYYFYYRHGKTYEYENRMQVPADVYSEYQTGDTISAYTTDHYVYSYGKEGILPKSEFANNEVKKGVGVLLGIGIAVTVLFGFVLA